MKFSEKIFFIVILMPLIIIKEMKMFKIFLFAALLFLVSIPLFAISYNSIRCGTYLVDLGASRYEVLKKCGEPDDIQKSNIEIVKHQRFIIAGAKYPYAGRMYDLYTTSVLLNAMKGEKYRFGEKHDHTSILKLLPPEFDGAAYTADGFTIRRTIVDPAFSWGEDLLEWRCVHEKIEWERFIYNLGGTSFLRYLTFENGRLVKIDTGEYGF